uniref:glycosyltransferase n=1 Tax=Terrisporobacter sp. TaxID=1965305 RepID=UPI00262F10AE
LYNYLPNEAIDNYDIDSNKILMISRLTKEKGVYEAINVMNDLREYNLKLILAGDSPELKDIKAYVKSKSLDDIIYFTGWIDDDKKYTLFKDCFVSILPSHFEGIPMSILESISFGVPVIASRVGGIPEIISDNEGYLHEAKNEKELRKLIIEMYENREKRIAFSKSCLKKYEGKFTESKHIRQLYNIYSELGSDNLCQV